MLVSFCFSKDGRNADDARDQANATGHPVLFFEGVFRYLLLPDDETLYDYTYKEDIFETDKKVHRYNFIRAFGQDPDLLLAERKRVEGL